jgi:hypothetical protein
MLIHSPLMQSQQMTALASCSAAARPLRQPQQWAVRDGPASMAENVNSLLPRNRNAVPM